MNTQLGPSVFRFLLPNYRITTTYQLLVCINDVNTEDLGTINGASPSLRALEPTQDT
jgi:hypothetical protein